MPAFAGAAAPAMPRPMVVAATAASIAFLIVVSFLFQASNERMIRKSGHMANLNSKHAI
jgi:hypothetical protein